MRDELSALAAAIEVGNAPLPFYLEKVISNAPESFDDLRAGQIAVTFRAMRATAEPINLAIIGEKHLPFLTFISSELANSSLQGDEAEYYAEKCWRAFQVRRAKSICEEMTHSLENAPKQAQTIIAAARTALDSITSEATVNAFTIRTPDEILDMVFSDDDIIVGDRIIAEGQSCVFVAAGGLGKSRISLQLAASVISRRKFLNFETGKENSKWLFIQTENSNRRLQSDLRPLKSWLGDDWQQFAARVVFHTVENDTDSFVSLDSPDEREAMEQISQTHDRDRLFYPAQGDDL